MKLIVYIDLKNNFMTDYGEANENNEAKIEN